MTPFVQDSDFTLYVGDVREVLAQLPDESVHCVVTSPPYWGLRDYGTEGQIGLEATPDEFVQAMVDVFREVRRVLRRDGTLWLNLGDSYNSAIPGATAGRFGQTVLDRGQQAYVKGMGERKDKSLKIKDLVGIPWRVAFALQADGWYLRSDIVWSKPNPMPESVTDRPTKAHEYVFLLTRSPRYYFDQEAVREPSEDKAGRVIPAGYKATWQNGNMVEGKQAGLRDPAHFEGCHPSGRNIRSVWEIATQPYPEAHFATFPEALPERCIKAGCPIGGTVLDPFMGSGTTALVARRLGRKSIGIELNQEYAELAARRLQQLSLLADAL